MYSVRWLYDQTDSSDEVEVKSENGGESQCPFGSN